MTKKKRIKPEPTPPPITPEDVLEAARAVETMNAPPLPSPTEPVSLFKTIQARNLVTELAKRKLESLRLYEPLPLAEQFHESKAYERILLGSNRSGKTLAAAVEVARAEIGRAHV